MMTYIGAIKLKEIPKRTTLNSGAPRGRGRAAWENSSAEPKRLCDPFHGRLSQALARIETAAAEGGEGPGPGPAHPGSTARSDRWYERN